MLRSELFFQYCPKLILFSADWKHVFLARRKGEADYDSTYSFIGGKTETTDLSLQAGIQREKDEEIGRSAHAKVCLDYSRPLLFRKKDGTSMIVPHHVAYFVGGKVVLNIDEYSEYKWVGLDELKDLNPKIENIEEQVKWALRLLPLLTDSDFVEI